MWNTFLSSLKLGGISGPMFQPELPEKGSLKMLLAILKRERLEKIPNGSMSVIDVRDLAALELAAVENPEAKGEQTSLE